MAFHDDFNRSVDPGWGTASSGTIVWDDSFVSPTHGAASVYGGYGHITADPLQNGGYMRSGDGGPWSVPEWTVTMRLAWSNDATATVIAFTGPNGTIGVQIGDNTIIVSDLVDDASGTQTVTLEAGSFYTLKIHFHEGLVLEAKIWPLGTSEPGWQVTGVPTAVADNDTYMLVNAPSIGTSTDYRSLRLDWLAFGIGSPVTDCGCVPFIASCACNKTDTFTRTVAEVVHSSNTGSHLIDIGPSDFGATYSNVVSGGGKWILSNGGVGVSVDGSALQVRTFSSAIGLTPGSASGFLDATVPMDTASTKRFAFTLSALPGNVGGAPQTILRIGFAFGNIGAFQPSVWINPQSAGAYNQSYIGFSASTTANATLIPDAWWTPGTRYVVTYRDDGAGVTISVSDGATTYSKLLSGHSTGTLANPQLSVTRDSTGGWTVVEEVIVTIDDLDIPEMNDCAAVVYDDFDRTEGSGWGDASFGPTWVEGDVGTVATSVSAGIAEVILSTDFAQCFMDTVVPAFMWAAAFTLKFGFWFDTLDSFLIGVYNSSDDTLEVRATVSATGQGEVITSTDDQSASKVDWVAATWYTFELTYEPGVSAELRIWPVTDPYPAALVTATAGDAYDSSGLTWEFAAIATGYHPTIRLSPITVQRCTAGTPTPNQPIHDELIGTGDGTTVVFYTRFPYNPATLEVEVDGEGEDFHPTNWRTGAVTMVTAPGAGLPVVASYWRSEYDP